MIFVSLVIIPHVLLYITLFQNGDVLPSINVQAAWDLGITGAGVKVAIVDQYLDLDHEDMKDNLVNVTIHQNNNEFETDLM